jgi:hypothetical protein
MLADVESLLARVLALAAPPNANQVRGITISATANMSPWEPPGRRNIRA